MTIRVTAPLGSLLILGLEDLRLLVRRAGFLALRFDMSAGIVLQVGPDAKKAGDERSRWRG